MNDAPYWATFVFFAGEPYYANSVGYSLSKDAKGPDLKWLGTEQYAYWFTRSDSKHVNRKLEND